MALATRCPACSTIFRISTAQAAAKGGMVRCGQCRNVFNSLDALVRVEDFDLVDEAGAEPESVSSVPAAEPRVDDGRVAVTLEPIFPHSEISEVLASLSAPTEDHATSHAWWMPDPAGRREPSAAASTPPALRTPPASASASSLPTPTPTLHDPSRVAMRAIPADRDHDSGDADPPAAAIRSVEVDPPAAPWGTPDDGTGPVFMQPALPAEPLQRAARWTWGALAFLALLLLLGQVAYMERDELAARWSPSRPWLATACTMLGCKVDYPVHVDAITIESATVQTSTLNADLYVLTALLRNRDTIDVRYPYLELVLTDVSGRTVLRRVLRPEDYATLRPDGRALASTGFAAQSELTVRLTFELADLPFAGYRLDQFYP